MAWRKSSMDHGGIPAMLRKISSLGLLGALLLAVSGCVVYDDRPYFGGRGGYYGGHGHHHHHYHGHRGHRGHWR
jgi:hypothetical protein